MGVHAASLRGEQHLVGLMGGVRSPPLVLDTRALAAILPGRGCGAVTSGVARVGIKLCASAHTDCTRVNKAFQAARRQRVLRCHTRWTRSAVDVCHLMYNGRDSHPSALIQSKIGNCYFFWS